jgi:hypothetical protein
MRSLSVVLLVTLSLLGCDSAPSAIEGPPAYVHPSESATAPSEITFRVRTRFLDSVRVDYFLGDVDFSEWVSPEWEVTLPYSDGPKGMQATGPSKWKGFITSELWIDDDLVDTRTAKMGHVRGVVAGVVADLGDSYRVEVELTNVREATSVPSRSWGRAWMTFKGKFRTSASGPVWEENSQYCRSSWLTLDVGPGDRFRVRSAPEGEVGYTILLGDQLDGEEGERIPIRRFELLRSRLERSTKTYFYFP